jgi:sugar transport protein
MSDSMVKSRSKSLPGGSGSRLKIGERYPQVLGVAALVGAHLGVTVGGPVHTLGGIGAQAERGPPGVEIFPVRVRTTSHGIAAASGKIGAFIGTYALTALLPAIGLADTSALVAGVWVLGLLATVTLLPEPKGLSLEAITQAAYTGQVVTVPMPERRQARPPAA